MTLMFVNVLTVGPTRQSLHDKHYTLYSQGRRQVENSVVDRRRE